MGSGSGGDVLDVLVSGYASIDVAYRASAPPRAGATALLLGTVVPSPRGGGCGPGAAMAMARNGLNVGLVTWLGDDREGQACLRTWVEAGVDCRGVVIAPGQASPRGYLFYDPEGGATCYYHPSGSAALRLNATGRDLLAGARALAVTVGPAALTEELLAARRPGQLLAWNVKADAAAFPTDLRRRLMWEADVICLNRDELPFVAAALPCSTALFPSHSSRTRGNDVGARHAVPSASLPAHRAGYPLGGGLGEGSLRRWGEGEPEDTTTASMTDAIQRYSRGIVVVTAGAAGCRVICPAGVSDVPAVPVEVADPTGAGDAFFGAFVAGWMHGADPPDAAAFATEHVAAFLRERAAGEVGV